MPISPPRTTPSLIFASEGGQYPSLTDTDRDGPSISQAEYAAALDAEGAGTPLPVSIYVHLPFCPSRCLSCDHDTTVTHDGTVIDCYLDSLEQEVTQVTDRLGRKRHALQVHLGGGTPNYLSDPQLVRLAGILETHFTIDAATETSLEASPKRSSWTQLALLRGLGFRRINFEVRDLDAGVQMALGRSHSQSILQDVFDNAHEAGFETVSMDLVYGLPNQTLASIRRTIGQIVELQPDRVACFAYSRRPEAFLHQRAINPASLPSLGDRLAMFNAVVEAMTAAGYAWIGLDSFVKRGDSLAAAPATQSLHRSRIGYTLHENADLLGFGTSAISEVGGLCVQNHLEISPWADAVSNNIFPFRKGVQWSREQRNQRNTLTDLMCNLELPITPELSCDNGALGSLAKDGLVDISEQRVTVTPQGRFVLHQLWGDSSPQFRWASAL